MDVNGLTTIPMFFVSPVADASLAYSNIMAEWLSSSKQVGTLKLADLLQVCIF
jgi:integrator complex subunit 9